MRSFLIGVAVFVFILFALAPAVAEGPSTVKAKIALCILGRRAAVPARGIYL